MLPIRPEQKPDKDAHAQEEVEALEREDLEAVERRQEHQRRERLRSLFANGVMALIVVIFVLVAFALVSVAWHYLGPSQAHWMDDDALGTTSTVLFSGTLFVFLGLYIRDRV